jgi:diguanylate cyclase (GGDEF)-like protein
VDAIFRTPGRAGRTQVLTRGTQLLNAGARLLNVRAWPFWKLPRSVRAFVLAVILIDAAAIAASAAALTVRAHDLTVFGLLLVCNGATVELTRRTSEPEGHVNDVHAVWELPVVVLLPPLYALLMPIVRLALTQWRIRLPAVYKRVFTAAAISVSYACASLTFRGLRHLASGPGAAPGPGPGPALGSDVTIWLLLVSACAIVQLAVNQYLVFAAVRATNPATRAREFIFSPQTLRNDLTEMCMAVLSTLAIAMSLLTVLIALPLATLLQRSALHVQLMKDARTDSKTSLLNAATWERGATAEVARAVRTRTALALALLDIDRFKVINDTYGHLTGDEVLKEIAHTLKTMLREYDLAGRFGGEEFALLLPQTRAVDAFRIAERIRSAISGLCIIAPGATGGERVTVTVSIGVAALDSGSRREYAELMAAADAALYRAKGGGRDQVQMISTTRGLSAVSSLPRAAVGESAAQGPSLFRRAAGS